jgi:hypothetical protein
MKKMSFFKNVIYCTLVVLVCKNSIAANFSSVQSGNWNDPLTWHVAGTAGTPIAGDIVTISSSHQVIVTTNSFCRRLIVNGSNRSIVLNSGVKLTLTGLISLSSSADLNWCQGNGIFRFVGDSERGEPSANSNLLISSSSVGYTRYNSTINIEVELNDNTDKVHINNSTFICNSIRVIKGILQFNNSGNGDVLFNTSSNGTGGSVVVETNGTLILGSVGRRVDNTSTTPSSEVSNSFIETLTIDGTLELKTAGSAGSRGFAAKNITINGRFIIANSAGSAVVSSPTDAIAWGTNSILEYASTTSTGFQNMGAEISRNGGNTSTIGTIIINTTGSATEIRTFSRSVNVRNELKFVSGKIQFGASTEKITLLSTAQITGADSTKFVYYSGSTSAANKGLVKLGIPAGQIFEFPVGLVDGTTFYYTPVLITNHSGAALDYEVSIALFNLRTRVSGTTVAVDFTELSGYQGRLNAEWNMGKVGGTASNVDIQIRYRNLTTTGSFTHANAQLVHYTGPDWDSPLTTTYNPVSNQYLRSIKVLNYTGPFSPFGIGDFGISSTPLPIVLKEFNAENFSSKNEIYWTTATERNNSFFTIERSTDLQHWIKIATIDGAGNSSHEINYSIWDENPLIGIQYYRLSQTDFDGTTTTFEPVSVNVQSMSNEAYTVFPNPTTGNLNIQVKDTYQTIESVEVFDFTGKSVLFYENNTKSHMQLSLGNLPNGMYWIQLNSTSNSERFSIVKK